MLRHAFRAIGTILISAVAALVLVLCALLVLLLGCYFAMWQPKTAPWPVTLGNLVRRT